MKKKFLLLLLTLSIFSFWGCTNNTTDNNETVHKETGDTVAFTLVDESEAADGIKSYIKESGDYAARALFRDNDDFYVILKSLKGQVVYSIANITIEEYNEKQIVAIELKEDASDDPANTKIYKLENMTYESGVIFRVNNGANDKGNTKEDAKKDKEDSNTASNEKVTIDITNPGENDTFDSGTVNFSGTATGDATKVAAVLTDSDGKKLGTTTAYIADLDKTFDGKINYEFSDDTNKSSDGTVTAKLKLTCTDNDGNSLCDKEITVKLK